jgi:quinol monooxygenase YgiN
LAKIADYARANDPNTTKHATHLSTDPADPFTVVAIEEYASQEAADAHMKWPPVLEFLEQWQADPGRLNGPPQIWHSTHAVQGFTRDAMKDAKDPYVLIATMQYSSEEDKKKAISEWGPEVQINSKEEPGTLSYAIGDDVENQNRLTFVEAYESEPYLKDVHMKSAGLVKMMKAEEERKPELKIWFLKKVAGYLHK